MASSCWDIIAADTKSEVSVSTMIDLSGTKCMRTGVEQKAFFRWSKDSWQAGIQVNLTSFLVRTVMGDHIPEKPKMNCRWKLVKPMKPWTSLTDPGVAQSWTAETLTGCTVIPLGVLNNPKNVVS